MSTVGKRSTVRHSLAIGLIMLAAIWILEDRSREFKFDNATETTYLLDIDFVLSELYHLEHDYLLRYRGKGSH